MHTLLDLRGGSFRARHARMASCTTFMALDMLLPEAGAIFVVDRGCVYVDLCPPLCGHQAGAFFVTRAKSNIDAHRQSIRRRRIARPASFATRPSRPGRLLHPSGLPPNFWRRIRFKDPVSGKTPWSRHHQPNFRFRPPPSRALYRKPLCRWNSSSSGSSSIFGSSAFYGTSENAVKTQIWIAVSVYQPESSPSKKRLDLDASLYDFVTDPLGDPLRENAHTSSTCGRRKQMQRFANNQPIEFIRFLTGH